MTWAARPARPRCPVRTAAISRMPCAPVSTASFRCTIRAMSSSSGLTSDSRKVKPGYLFAALAGTKTDGARFVKDAVARGAVAVMGAPALAADVAALGVRFIPQENPRAALAHFAAAFFAGQPEIVA